MPSGLTATPNGFTPTDTVAMTVLAAVLMTETVLDPKLVTYAVAPFGQSAPGRVNGPEHMRGVAAWLLAQFPDIHMTIEAIVAEGDTVAARVLSKGTNLGNWLVPEG